LELQDNMSDQPVFFLLPEPVLMFIVYDMIGGYEGCSSFGSTCRQIANFPSFWRLLYQFASGTQNSKNQRASRSSTSPRVALFLCLRAQRRASFNFFVLSRKSFERKDSPSCLRRLLKPVLAFLPHSRLCELCMWAAYSCRWNCVKTLVSEFGVSPSFVCSERGETLVLLASWHGNEKILEWLLALPQIKEAIALQGYLQAKATLKQTSLCSGKGPFTALEWCQRKGKACPDRKGFKKCVDLLARLETLEM